MVPMFLHVRKLYICRVNIFMSEFGSLQTVVKTKLFYLYYCALYGSQIWPLWHHSVNKMCIQWRNALSKIWKLPNGSLRDLIPIITECIPLL